MPPPPHSAPSCHRVVECDSAQHLYDKYDHLVSLLAERERAIYDDWQTGVTELIQSRLQLPLITRHENTVEVNFDPQVRCATGRGRMDGP